MNLTPIPDQLHCMLFPIKLVQRVIRNRKRIPHSQLSIGDIIFLLLSELGLIKIGIDELVKIVVDVIYFRFLFGEEPRQE